MWRVFLAATSLALLAVLGARAQDLLPVPPLEGRVIDRTNTLDSTQRQAMEQHLANVERELGTQIVVLMVAVVLLVVQGFVINRAAGIDYPVWSPVNSS